MQQAQTGSQPRLGVGRHLGLEAWNEHSGVRLLDLGVEIASLRRASDAQLELKLSDDGRAVEMEVRYARGVLENPMTKAELAAKFEDCTGHYSNRDDGIALGAVLESLDTLDDIGQILGTV